MGFLDETGLSSFFTKLKTAYFNHMVSDTTFQTVLADYLQNNGTTTAQGYALDARYGKTLNDAVDTLNSDKVGKTFSNTDLTAYLQNNGTTIDSGYALDARYGKTLKDAVDGLNSDVDALDSGKVSKTFNSTDLSAYLQNNGTTTTDGYALDAKYGKMLADEISSLNSSISSYTGINLATGVTMYLNKQIRFGVIVLNTGSSSFSEANIVDENGASIIPKVTFNSMCQYYSGNSSQGNVVGKIRATSNGKVLLTELTDVQVTRTYVYGAIWFVY